MAYLNASHPGLAFGDGYMQGAGSKGQFVKLAGDDTFAVNAVAADRSFGVLMKDYADGEMPGVWCCGGVYETDQYSGAVAADGMLEIDANGKLVPATTGFQVAQAIGVSGGILKFKLLV